MTKSPSWPRIGPDRWTHLTVILEHADRPGTSPVATFAVWGRYPALVVRESVDRKLVREVRANAGASASLDIGRRLCLVETGLDADKANHAAIALVAGPVAQLYGAKTLDGWQSRSVGGTVTYYNDGPGPLRQATIDPETGLPLEADSVDGRWRWVIRVVGNRSPSRARNVTAWAKESHERTDLLAGRVKHIRYRSSSLPEPLEFISTVGGKRPTRVVIGHESEDEDAQLKHPDGRAATLLKGNSEVAQHLIEQVAERLVADREVPGADKDVGQWDRQINTLVGSITPRVRRSARANVASPSRKSGPGSS